MFNSVERELERVAYCLGNLKTLESQAKFPRVG